MMMIINTSPWSPIKRKFEGRAYFKKDKNKQNETAHHLVSNPNFKLFEKRITIGLSTTMDHTTPISDIPLCQIVTGQMDKWTKGEKREDREEMLILFSIFALTHSSLLL